MLRVALVEDEKVVLKGMTMVLQREKTIELVGTAEDGLAGLELIRREQPDIVFTDIRMPGMTGLEMIEAAKRDYPDIVYIIFSGFNEFKYVQRAIGIGVLDYLEKPVTVSDLHRVLQKAGDMVLYKKNYMEMKERSGQINRVLIEQALSRLLNQPAEMEEENLEYLLEVGSELENSSEFAVLVISKVIRNQTDSDLYRQIIHKMTFSLYENRHFEVFTLAQEENLLFVYFNQECEVFDFYSRISEAKAELQEKGIVFYAGLSNSYTDLQDLKTAFTEAMHALNYAGAKEGTPLVCAEEAAEDAADPQEKTGAERPEVRIVKQYIDENYAESITLELLAERVHLNPAYLSVIFKKELGISYSNYLAQVRIREARKMLEAGKKAKEVCVGVGYIDYRYFNKQFKNAVGMTPDTYRRRQMLEQQS